jgi:hypothetical protein
MIQARDQHLDQEDSKKMRDLILKIHNNGIPAKTGTPK